MDTRLAINPATATPNRIRGSTGGGAIFHGDELTYSVVCPAGTPGVPRDTIGAYHAVHGFIAAVYPTDRATLPASDT